MQQSKTKIPAKKLTFFGFLAMTISMVVSLYEYPTFATSGFSLVFFLLLGGFFLFLRAKRKSRKHLSAFCSSRITFRYLRFPDNGPDPIPYNLRGPPSYPDASAQRIH